jgi:hypothetical protein
MTVISRKRRRGWVMVAVLMVVFVITLMASAFFLQASDAASMNSMGSAVTIAATNADLGFKNGVRELRNGNLVVAALQNLPPCAEAAVAADSCANIVNSAIVNNGPDAGLGAGGGLQYQFSVYRRARPDGSEDPGQPRNRFTIRSIGYYGYTLNSANLVTSIVEGEIEIGSQTAFQCVGGYECQ